MSTGWLIGILIGMLVAALAALGAPPAADAAGARRVVPVSASVDLSHPGAVVPKDFLGLSFELSSLPLLASYAQQGDLVALLRSLGPGVLRFGGVSADTRVAWRDEPAPLPSWASGELQAADLRELAVLAARTGWRVLLTIGLGHFEPAAAAREVAAAKTALGPWLEAIELGNEPNAWALHGLRSEPWTFVQYDEQLSAYRAAIEAAAPGVPLAGPDTSGSSAFENWAPAEVVDQRPAMLTGHHYALGCAEQPPPSIERLLSHHTQQLEQASLSRSVAVARAAETPLRLDEINNISCGGVAGISDTFASALWAVGYLTQAMTAGVAGVNLHGIPSNCAGYAPLCAPTPQDLAAGVLYPQPEWYALLLAKALIGERPLPTITIPTPKVNLRLAALLAGDGTVHVVIVDDDPRGARSVLVRLRAGSRFSGASVLALTAPSPAALVGVRLAGRAVASERPWSPPAVLPRVPNEHGVISVEINPSSAALLTLTPRRATLSPHARA
jgi:hypothetical protein